MEVKDALIYGVNLLEGVSADPLVEARKILAYILEIKPLDLILYEEKIIDSDTLAKYQLILEQRKLFKPLAYILGEAYFMGHKFYVNEETLIPRMDTERSVEVVHKLINGDALKILEIGIGTGCVSLSLAMENPQAVFHGVDISEDALTIALKNQERYSLSNIKFWKSSLFDEITMNYDIIYSNPPYIETEVLETLDPSVRNYEPYLALDGGKDGLDFYRKIIKKAVNYLKPNGKLVVEIGYNQLDSVLSLFNRNYYIDLTTTYDYGGHPRVITGTKGR